MNIDKSQPRLAATVAVVRDAPAGMEVLLLERADKGDHNSGAWVFPGGLIDAADRQAQAHCVGLDDAQASRQLGLPGGGLDQFIAAVRETFEEAGLLLATDSQGRALDLQSEAGLRLAERRSSLGSGSSDMASLCREFGLQLHTESLHYIAHWLTPVGRAKRFDTRFFVAVLPPGQVPAADAVETVQQVWLRPEQALSAENTRRLMTPTQAVIRQLAAFADTQGLLAWARTPREVRRVLPRLAKGSNGLAPVLPWHGAWHELGRLDPDGRGDAWSDLQPGVPVALSPAVQRFTAKGSNDNSYLVDCGPQGWAVIDPGQGGAAEVDALIAAAAGPIRWICLTDGTATPSALVGALQDRTGAVLIEPGAAPAGTLPTGLQAQPGELPGTQSYLLQAEDLLFVGAHAPGAAALRSHPAAWIAARQGFLRPAISNDQAAP